MRFLQCCVYSLDIMINFRDHSESEKTRKYLSILLAPVGIFKYITCSLSAHIKKIDAPNKIAVICIVKNEGRYIKEFIEYYIGLGCDIVAYDNGSTDNTAEILKEYPEHVKYIFYPGVKRQIDAYNQALKRFKGAYKYLLYVDADEFLVSDDVINGKKLIDVINDFFKKSSSIACLGINWLIFGSAGYDEFPAEGGYSKTLPDVPKIISNETDS